MGAVPSELFFLLLFAVLVAAALLFNLVMKKAAEQQRHEAAQPQPVHEEDVPEQPRRGAQPRAPVAAGSSRAAPSRSAEASAASPARPRLRVTRQSLFGTRRDVQEAMVVATILGRCRADEPHDIR